MSRCCSSQHIICSQVKPSKRFLRAGSPRKIQPLFTLTTTIITMITMRSFAILSLSAATLALPNPLTPLFRLYNTTADDQVIIKDPIMITEEPLVSPGTMDPNNCLKNTTLGYMS